MALTADRFCELKDGDKEPQQMICPADEQAETVKEAPKAQEEGESEANQTAMVMHCYDMRGIIDINVKT